MRKVNGAMLADIQHKLENDVVEQATVISENFRAGLESISLNDKTVTLSDYIESYFIDAIQAIALDDKSRKKLRLIIEICYDNPTATEKGAVTFKLWANNTDEPVTEGVLISGPQCFMNFCGQVADVTMRDILTKILDSEYFVLSKPKEDPLGIFIITLKA